MGPLKKCWAPCFTINSGFLSLRNASIIISFYTALIHVLIFFYSVFILNKGQSDAFYSPLFEFNRYGMNCISIFLIIYSWIFILCCCFGLIHGIQTVGFKNFLKPSEIFSHFLSFSLIFSHFFSLFSMFFIYFLPHFYINWIFIFCCCFGLIQAFKQWVPKTFFHFLSLYFTFNLFQTFHASISP